MSILNLWRNRRRTHNTAQFTVGEVINPSDYTIRLRIITIDPLRAEVYQTSNFKPVAYWFPVGRTLSFKPSSVENAWFIDNPGDMPWFVLWVNPNGEKRFEYYR